MNIITVNHLITIKRDKNFQIKKLFFDFSSNHMISAQLILLKDVKIKLKTL